MTTAALKALWRWSWLVTVPATVLLLLWASATADMYWKFKLRFNDNERLDLATMGSLQASFLLNKIGSKVLPTPRGGGLDAVHLYVPESGLRKLDSDLPHSGRQYMEAMLKYPDGQIRKAQVKYRGDYSYHWIGEKKSIRVKTRKGSLYDGVRQFNLIVPKTPYIFDNHLPYLVARRMGLPAPETRLVEVYLNGTYMGVQILIEQLGEQFLRRSGFMPGDLYVGEMVGKDSFPGVPREVFLNPAFWAKDAHSNHNPPEWNEALRALSTALYQEDMDALLGLIDLDAWARFAAFVTITRTSHFDSMHNWRLFFDPSMGRFVPVVWDPAGWNFKAYVDWISRLSNRMDIVSSLVFERLHSDHSFLAAKHAAVEEFFREGGQEFIMSVLSETAALNSSLARDRNLYFDALYTLTPREVIAEIAAFRDKVGASLAEVKKAYLEDAPSAAWAWDQETGSVRVNVSSFAPVRRMEIDFDSPVIAEGAAVSFTQDGRTVRRPLASAASVSGGSTLVVEAPLFAARAMGPVAQGVPVLLRDVAIMPASYSIEVKGAGGRKGAKALAVRAGFAGGLAELERAKTLPSYPLDNNSSAAPLPPRPTETVWSGEQVLRGVTEIRGDLTLRPGTTVRLDEGASVVLFGRLSALGTADRPVRFVPLRAGQRPWGALVISGGGADGSRLEHCFMSGGSGLRHRLVEYSAMLSVHGVKGVVIESCSFSDNHETDDMVHAVYSEIAFRACTFTGARSDALDLDISTGVIERSVFTGSGNDGLDLMTSEVAVLSSRMEGSGDKGISVGEGTSAFVWNTLIRGNEIGLQAKDTSTALVYNSELAGNSKSLDAYKKNWQYGTGGHALVLGSSITGPGLISADKDSSVRIYGSTVEGGKGGKAKKVQIEAAGPAPGMKLPQGVSLPAFMAPHLDLVDPSARGRIGDGA